MLFKYTRYLEVRIEELKQEKKELQARNDRLVEVLIPMLRKIQAESAAKPTPTTVETVREAVKSGHQITRGDKIVSCTCGWREESDDPEKLQESISLHYRENVQTLRGGRKNWPQARAALESQAEISQKEEKPV